MRSRTETETLASLLDIQSGTWNTYLSLICNLSLLTPPRCKNIKKISCDLWKISIAWMLIAQEDYCCAKRTEIELLMFLLDMGNAIYFLSGIVLNSVIVINESYVIDLSFVFDQKRIHSPLTLWWRNNKKFKTGELKYYSFINQYFWKFRHRKSIFTFNSYSKNLPILENWNHLDAIDPTFSDASHHDALVIDQCRVLKNFHRCWKNCYIRMKIIVV